MPTWRLLPFIVPTTLDRASILHLTQVLVVSWLQHNTLGPSACSSLWFWWQERSSVPLEKQRKEMAAVAGGLISDINSHVFPSHGLINCFKLCHLEKLTMHMPLLVISQLL